MARIPKVPDAGLELGDYVFASRWSDGNPNDPWAVGFVSVLDDRIKVIDARDGNCIPGVGVRRWPHARKISKSVGAEIVRLYPGMEGEPFGIQEVDEIFAYEDA